MIETDIQNKIIIVTRDREDFINAHVLNHKKFSLITIGYIVFKNHNFETFDKCSLDRWYDCLPCKYYSESQYSQFHLFLYISSPYISIIHVNNHIQLFSYPINNIINAFFLHFYFYHMLSAISPAIPPSVLNFTTKHRQSNQYFIIYFKLI